MSTEAFNLYTVLEPNTMLTLYRMAEDKHVNTQRALSMAPVMRHGLMSFCEGIVSEFSRFPAIIKPFTLPSGILDLQEFGLLGGARMLTVDSFKTRARFKQRDKPYWHANNTDAWHVAMMMVDETVIRMKHHMGAKRARGIVGIYVPYVPIIPSLLSAGDGRLAFQQRAGFEVVEAADFSRRVKR